MDTLTRQRVQQVHLSYLAMNDAVAETVATELIRSGIRTSRSAILSNTVSDDEKIATDIRDASAIILLCTNESLHDRRIRQELQLAWRFDRPIVPMLLEPLLFPDDVAYWLEGTQWIEAYDREDAWPEELLGALVAHGMRPDGVEGAGAALPHHRSTVFLPKTDIPAPAGRLVGREAELLELSRQLASHRLITITGPGGTGKTRLAIDLAQLVRPLFPDGVFFVELGTASGAAAVPEFIARKLRIGSFAGESFSTAVLTALRDRRLLLVLDNFEHVLPAAAFVSQILWDCADVSVLITSRASTGIAGGIEFELGPFDLPDNSAQLPLTELTKLAAIEFFVERAQAANPGFALTRENASDVAKLCAALDGLPLAMELMAGKAKVLTPAQMLQRFAGTAGILSVEGALDRPDRHRTLRKTIEWSVNLLSAEQRTAFAWLGVFSGGATLEAVESIFEQVASPDAPNVLDAVETLVQQHLLTHVERSDSEPRFRMLQSIRTFAAEALRAGDVAPAVYRAHAIYYLDLLVSAGQGLAGADQARWVALLDADYDNCRVAVEWAFANEPDPLLNAINGLWLYWAKHGGLYEGLAWIERLVSTISNAHLEVTSRLLNMMGNMALELGDFRRAETNFLQCRQLAQQLGARAREAAATLGLGRVAYSTGEYRRARQFHEDALATAREIDDEELVAVCLDNIGDTYSAEEAYDRATLLHQRALDIVQMMGDIGGIAYSYWRIAGIAYRTQDLANAEAYAAEALSMFDDVRDVVGASYAQLVLGRIEWARGKDSEARTLVRKAIDIRLRERLTLLIVEAIETIALEEQEAPVDTIATLMAFCAHQRSSASCPPLPADARSIADRLAQLRNTLDPESFNRLWMRGQQIGLDTGTRQAIALLNPIEIASE